MNPIVDTIMIILFVLFMIYIFRGYHIQRLEKVEEEMKNECEEESRSKEGEKKEGS